MTQSISVSIGVEVAGLDGVEGAAPEVEDLLACPGCRMPSRSTNSTALSRYSRCMSRADSSRPLASRTVARPVGSWLISRMARIGFSRVRSRMTDARLDHPQHEVGGCRP